MYIIKSLTENQTADHVKATTTPKVHQQNTAIQTEVIPKTWSHEEITPQYSHDSSKTIPNANVHKSENNPSLK